jgi:hypothetical protein
MVFENRVFEKRVFANTVFENRVFEKRVSANTVFENRVLGGILGLRGMKRQKCGEIYIMRTS